MGRLTRRTFVKRASLTGVAAGSALFLSQEAFPAHEARITQASHDNTLGAGITILLVHGAFVDASSWNKVIPHLQSSGFSVLAVQNPLTSFNDDITTTNQALASLSGPTILVGHSYGGKVISNVGQTAKNLICMVFIAAYAPEEGESVESINTPFPTPPAVSHIVPSYRSGFVWLDPPVFPQNFIQDVNITEARALAVAQKPTAPACLQAPPSGEPTWKRVPSWYLVSTEDRVIHPDAERFMARRMGATTREIASSHASPVSHPREVFELIVAASKR